MKWTHLPVTGGLYDQHPALLDDWYVISKAEAEQMRREAAEREAKKPKPSGYGGGKRSRRR